MQITRGEGSDPSLLPSLLRGHPRHLKRMGGVELFSVSATVEEFPKTTKRLIVVVPLAASGRYAVLAACPRAPRPVDKAAAAEILNAAADSGGAMPTTPTAATLVVDVSETSSRSPVGQLRDSCRHRGLPLGQAMFHGMSVSSCVSGARDILTIGVAVPAVVLLA